MNRIKSASFVIATVSVTVTVIGLVAVVGDTALGAGATAPSAGEMLHHALERARDAGSYRVSIDVLQTVYTPMPVFGNKVAPAEQSARLSIEGAVGSPTQARFTLRDGEIHGRTPVDHSSFPEIQETLVSGGKVYQRQGDQWVLQDDSPSTPGLTSDALMLLSVAKNVQSPGPIQTLGGTFERVSFTLDSDDVMAFMLQELGRLDEQTAAQVRLNGIRYGGMGELWIDSDGFPARLALDLALERGGQEAFKAHAASTALYSAFGENIPPAWFDPTLAPLSRLDTPPIPGSGLASEQAQGTGVMIFGVAAALALCVYLVSRARFGKRTYTTLVLALIATMVTPNIAQAARQGTTPSADSQPQKPSAVEDMAANMRRLGERQQANLTAKAGEMDPQADTDHDGLPNGYELKLGTNPFSRDSDLDGLDDGDEVNGVPCQLDNGQTHPVETDPLNPDSNYDGLRDGDEFNRGQCGFSFIHYPSYGYVPYAWNDDNDADGVPDGLDLSPFTKSDELGGSSNGANMSFELAFNYAGIPRNPYYFEVQVVPADKDTLQYAYKSALEWPVDDKGMIQHIPLSGTTGALQVAPFLEVQLDEDDAPDIDAMAQYGISTTQTPTGAFSMIIPLALVERGGKTYAFQAKVLQDRTSLDNVIRWRDMRLKWAVQGDVLRPDGSGQMVRSPTGSYGLVIYDEPYIITGVRASRQGGASSIVAGAIPQAGQPIDAGPATLLRAGLEAQFLGGRLSLNDIYERFNDPIASTVNITQQWGITQTFRVSPPQHFQHLDQMLLTTNVTTTREVLDELYLSHYTDKPTLIIASEQRTATLNVDELEESDLANLTLVMCLKQMTTSRTLKLATYRWEQAPSALFAAANDPLVPSASQSSLSSSAVDDWRMLGLDEVLEYVQEQFYETRSPLQQLDDDMLTILQMAATVWYQGQTVLQSIGAIDLTNITDALDDPNFYASVLSMLGQQRGPFSSLPSEFCQVVEFVLGVLNYPGGPLKWLEDQWNTIIMVGDEVLGGFKDFGSSPGLTPDSLIGFTQTAINVLTWLASVFDLDFLGDVVKILSTLLEIFKKVQELWNTIEALATQGAGLVGEAVNAALSELSATSSSIQILGLVMSIASTLFNLFLQLASGNLSALGVIGVVLQAVHQIAIAIVLFVVAAIFPIGTLVAIGIALVQLVTGFLKDYLGAVGTVVSFILDPIGAFLEALNPDPEPLVFFFGNPSLGSLKFETWPDQPLGGIVEKNNFSLRIPGTTTMSGNPDALNGSYAWMRLGRYANGEPFEVCDFVQMMSYANLLQSESGLQFADMHGICARFKLYHSSSIHLYREGLYNASGVYLTDKVPGIDFPLPFAFAVRDFYSSARMNIYPYAQINAKIAADLSFEVQQVWENCGILGLDCDVYPEHYEAPPSVSFLYFDILPNDLTRFWEWVSLINHDPDGDGLFGNDAAHSGQDVPGEDINLCGNPYSHVQLDTDGDGLSDSFEKYDYGTDPCERDSDSDYLTDYEEFLLGTDPHQVDTDGDGITDGSEVSRWSVSSSFHLLSPPWRVEMSSAYPGYPNLRAKPAAFPNPRLANADRDGRSDKKEKELFSSPNGFNISDMDVAISQDLLWGGGTRVSVTNLPWLNDVAPAFLPVLTITLPITFTGLTRSARVANKDVALGGTPGTPIPGTAPNVYAWSFQPITLDQLVTATVAGLPAVIPRDVVSVTVELSYEEAGIPRKVTHVEPLRINRGGPATAITVPADDSIVSALNNPVRIQGTANDPEGPGVVQVCIGASPFCAAWDWKNAILPSPHLPGWYYDWTPSADGTYTVSARAWDVYGVTGTLISPITIKVDSTLPLSASFDADSTVFISTTLTPETLATFTVTGHITEAVGAAYVSGVGGAHVPAQRIARAGGGGDEVNAPRPSSESTIANLGAATSAFSTRFSLPMMAANGGRASPSAQGLYHLRLNASDRAGNTLANSDELDVIVDDTPPFVYLRPPQTVSTTTLLLGGRADDRALDLRRTQSEQQPYTTTQTVAARDTEFTVNARTPMRAYAVGDLNGDTIDDVVGIHWNPGHPLQGGIFYGHVSGYSSTLTLDQADVQIVGEADFTTTHSYGPLVAINAPDPFDVNGDGIADLLIGDPNVNDGAGRAYVLLGRFTWPRTTISLGDADWRLSVAGTAFFGGSVASAGDVDGDGLSDVLVGAAQENVYYEVASLYLGQERGVPARQSRLYGRICIIPCPTPLVPNLAGLGDTDGDGLSDVLLAGYQGAWLLPGRSKLEWPASGTAISNSIGLLLANGQQQTVAPAGDVNGDGLRDMLVGDPLATLARVFVVFGRRGENPFPTPPLPFTLTTSADMSFRGFAGVGNWSLGEGLTPMGDLDRDGKGDFAFGRAGTSDGAAIVLGGRTPYLRDMPPYSATNFIYDTASQLAGGYLSSGDVNGDTVRDLMVGAPGANAAYLFEGDSPSFVVAGIQRVEVGVSGPIVTPSLPYTATLPTTWHSASLLYPGMFATPFSVELAFGADGDYRVYARTADRASNQLPDQAWYVGTLLVNTSAAAIPAITSTLDLPALFREGYLRVDASGVITSPNSIQHLRTFDGERWTRMPLLAAAPGAWSNESNIERSDKRQITFRAVARDAFGNTTHAVQRVTTDTLVARPVLWANLPANDWQTNIMPTLVVTWEAVIDAGGPVTTYAVIDTFTKTVPMNLITADQVTRTLDAPGAWYAHVRVRDQAGNQRLLHDGPFVLNRSKTPSAILPDGWMDFEGYEYKEAMVMSYDPYAAIKPWLLSTTWNTSTFYLGLMDSDWSLDKRLAVYLDTRAGGLAQSLGSVMPGGEPTHTLPFAADYALVVTGQTSYTLYSNAGPGWVVSPTAATFAVARQNTEIAFDRASLGIANTPVSLLAYAATSEGVVAVIPASARVTTTAVMSGPLTFADSLHWDTLADGYPATPADLPVQWIAPVVSINPGYDTQLIPSELATMTIHIVNPDIVQYYHWLTVTLGQAVPQLMEFVSLVDGATCVDCPPHGREWVVRITAFQYEPIDVVLTARALTPPSAGVFAVPVSATLAYQGLPAAPQPPATTAYVIDNNVGKLEFNAAGATILAKPGEFKLPFFISPKSSFLSCKQEVSVDKGDGFESLGLLSQIASVTHTLPAGYNQVWTLQVIADNGQVSTDTVIVQVDSTPPFAQITSTLVLTGPVSLLHGLADDDLSLGKVQVSMNGGPFQTAILNNRSSLASRAQSLATGPTGWTFPVNANGFDGEQVQFVVRSIDEAGNVSPSSAPVTVTLDTTGPAITVTQSTSITIAGSVVDGSGVAQVKISLDGGVSYQMAALTSSGWTFDPAEWTGGAPTEWVIVRALDVCGNVSQYVVEGEGVQPQPHRVYLPLVLKN
jgi:hypothetical protein